MWQLSRQSLSRHQQNRNKIYVYLNLLLNIICTCSCNVNCLQHKRNPLCGNFAGQTWADKRNIENSSFLEFFFFNFNINKKIPVRTRTPARTRRKEVTRTSTFGKDSKRRDDVTVRWRNNCVDISLVFHYKTLPLASVLKLISENWMFKKLYSEGLYQSITPKTILPGQLNFLKNGYQNVSKHLQNKL